MRRLLVCAGFLMGVLCMGPEAQAASPTEQLRGFFSAATRILDPQTDDGLEARLGAIRAIVKEIVDVPAAPARWGRTGTRGRRPSVRSSSGSSPSCSSAR